MNTGKLWGETSGISVQQIMLKLKGIYFLILHTHTVYYCILFTVYCIRKSKKYEYSEHILLTRIPTKIRILPKTVNIRIIKRHTSNRAEELDSRVQRTVQADCIRFVETPARPPL